MRIPEVAHAVCPRCGHGVIRFPCWNCGLAVLRSVTLVLLGALLIAGCCTRDLVTYRCVQDVPFPTVTNQKESQK